MVTREEAIAVVWYGTLGNITPQAKALVVDVLQHLFETGLDSYAVHYGEGVIETRVPRGVYDEHFAEYEMKYLGSPPGTELAIPAHKLDLLSQFERIWHR